MKHISIAVILLLVVLCASAETFYDANSYEIYNTDESYTSEHVPIATQYFATDEDGHTFGYAHPGQAAYNFRDENGYQIGSWAYFNPEGKEIRVSYIADYRGFRVVSNELPVAPTSVTDTPEVAAARAQHAAEHARIAAREATKRRSNTLLFDENMSEAPVLERWYIPVYKS